MKTIILLAFLVVLSARCLAQVDTTAAIVTALDKRSTVPDAASPLYVLKGDGLVAFVDGNKKEEAAQVLDAIEPKWIKEVVVLKDAKSTEKYGRLGGNGVIVIELKEGTFRQLPEALKKRFN